MTIKQALIKYRDIEIEILLTYLLDKSKEFLFAHPETELNSYQVKKLSSLIRRRRRGEPIAYILGYKDFYGLRFKVNKHVLIPRPETEELVELAIRAAKDQGSKINDKDPIKILDLGTGSGCVAIALAKKLLKTRLKLQITASDVSPEALGLARQNAKIHKVKINFVQSDLFNSLNSKFHIIVANLPYITARDYQSLQARLRYEPKTSLTDGTDRWFLFELFFKQAGKHLNPKAVILLEIDPKSPKYITRYCRLYLPDAKYRFHKDLAEKYRFVIIR